MFNTEEIEKVIMSAVQVAVKEALEEVTPIKEDAYCSYSLDKESFYISTTDDEAFNGYVTFDDVIKLFIEDHQYCDTSLIQPGYAKPFIDKLRAAADLIESKLDKTNDCFSCDKRFEVEDHNDRDEGYFCDDCLTDRR